MREHSWGRLVAADGVMRKLASASTKKASERQCVTYADSSMRIGFEDVRTRSMYSSGLTNYLDYWISLLTKQPASDLRRAEG